MKPARTTRTVWLWRSNNLHCGRLRLAFETSRASALVCRVGSTVAARRIRRASQRPAPEGNRLPASRRQVPLADSWRLGGGGRRRRCGDRAGRRLYAPQENIDAGTRYLRELLQKYNNDLVLTLAAYNAGPERVQQYGRVPPFPETLSYVRRVRRSYEKSKSKTSAKKPAPPGAMAATSQRRTGQSP